MLQPQFHAQGSYVPLSPKCCSGGVNECYKSKVNALAPEVHSRVFFSGALLRQSQSVSDSHEHRFSNAALEHK